jgi:hypothetical protein
MGQILEIIDESINQKQSPCQLERYLASPYSSTESLNDLKGNYPGAFKHIPKEVFLLMVDYLDDSNRRMLGQVCRPFSATIWSERPPNQDHFTFWFPKEIKYSRKQDLHKKRDIYKDNTSMGPVYYFGGIMNQCLPQFCEVNSPQFCEVNPFQFCEEDLFQCCEVNPPQWNIMTLEGETNDDTINQSWVNYLEECINLHFLKLVNVNNIDLNNIGKLTKLEMLFMKLKPVDRLYASITPPSNVKAIVVSISEECPTLLSERSIAGLYLETLEGTQLDIW